MSTLPAPRVSRAPAFPLVWVVPILAIGIGCWMALRELHNHGPMITIDFSDGSGVEAGKTVLDYKGVTAGTVESVELKPGLTGVVVRVRLRRSAGQLASRGAQFWIVRPEIGFNGVRGLDTLVSGVHLDVLPGTGPAERQFIGLDKTPAPDVKDEGRAFILKSDQLGSLTTGAPVVYREFKVGQVEASRISDDSTSVLIRIHLDAPYVDLVRTNTKFWNAGGFDFKMSLFGGAKLKDTSLESLISGGVAFATPDGPLAPAAPADTEFPIASEQEKDAQKWAPRIPIKSPDTIEEAHSKGGLIPGLIK
ncbi:MAG TPA: MlaD family protein [Opitutaceae bacterium]